MKTLTRQGFYRFIRNQPARKRMVHSKGWCECAVGDYIRDANIDSDDSAFSVALDFAEDNLPGYLFRVLNIFGAARRHVPTYGKLATFISKRGRV